MEASFLTKHLNVSSAVGKVMLGVGHAASHWQWCLALFWEWRGRACRGRPPKLSLSLHSPNTCTLNNHQALTSKIGCPTRSLRMLYNVHLKTQGFWWQAGIVCEGKGRKNRRCQGVVHPHWCSHACHSGLFVVLETAARTYPKTQTLDPKP